MLAIFTIPKNMYITGMFRCGTHSLSQSDTDSLLAREIFLAVVGTKSSVAHFKTPEKLASDNLGGLCCSFLSSNTTK